MTEARASAFGGYDEILVVVLVSGGDSDGDGFVDCVEVYIGTDPFDDCPATPTRNDEDPDAWPVDMNDDQDVNTLDIGKFRPVMFSQVGDPNYDRRFDLNTDGAINTLDIGKFRPFIFSQCT